MFANWSVNNNALYLSIKGLKNFELHNSSEADILIFFLQTDKWFSGAFKPINFRVSVEKCCSSCLLTFLLKGKERGEEF